MTNKLLDMEKVLKALAYHKRLDILDLLFKKKEAHVCEIADMLELPLVTVSRNLSTLTRANLIRARQKGSFLYYSINPNQDHFSKSILSILKSNLAGKKYLISHTEARLFDRRIRQSLKNFIEPEPER